MEEMEVSFSVQLAFATFTGAALATLWLTSDPRRFFIILAANVEGFAYCAGIPDAYEISEALGRRETFSGTAIRIRSG